jgi:hypothetical protein
MAALGFAWADVTVTQVYTIFDIHRAVFEAVFAARRRTIGVTPALFPALMYC